MAIPRTSSIICITSMFMGSSSTTKTLGKDGTTSKGAPQRRKQLVSSPALALGLSPSLQARPYPACAALAPIGMTQAVALRTTAGSVPGKATGVLAPHSREKAAADRQVQLLALPHELGRRVSLLNTRWRKVVWLGEQVLDLGIVLATRAQEEVALVALPGLLVIRKLGVAHSRGWLGLLALLIGGAIALSLAPARAQAHQRTRAVLVLAWRIQLDRNVAFWVLRYVLHFLKRQGPVIFSSGRGLPHLEGKGESAALARPVGVYRDGAAAPLHDLLDDEQAEPDAVTVHLGRPLQLAELAEEAWNLIRGNSSATVLHLHHQVIAGLVEKGPDQNEARVGELERIFDQVDQALEQSARVSQQFGQALAVRPVELPV
eukprot:CAMPEP_0185591042 /NCGR_PEP_ID=MMETSP0434-20130131/63165_1 /TAXON_ID=626734 ORGANISM="Favella taraikaensis, Strain Fe Narragansett Bay" /NCGR_SAMPLE_ID=MMETSP0434 /ASSEMBLY_ACC=CAM_ASM_000379 /LENGTH=374 /DNA_ID=CAMNT_0028215763 /DNA_START=340 /DNA_END=1466 /DNA_ORIENTATION=+